MPWTRKRGEAGGKRVRAVPCAGESSEHPGRSRAVARAPCSVVLAAEPILQPPGSLHLDLGIDMGGHGHWGIQVQAIVVGRVPEGQRSIFPW